MPYILFQFPRSECSEHVTGRGDASNPTQTYTTRAHEACNREAAIHGSLGFWNLEAYGSSTRKRKASHIIVEYRQNHSGVSPTASDHIVKTRPKVASLLSQIIHEMMGKECIVNINKPCTVQGTSVQPEAVHWFPISEDAHGLNCPYHP